MKFGDNLKLLRKERKLSQEDLAERMNVSRQSVSKWETGEAYPEMNNILQLCKIFGCKINSLVNDNIEDINSLDEEIKMSVVKFKEEKQKKVKGLSKAIMIIAKIAKVFVVIGAVCIALAATVVPIVCANVKVENNELKVFGEVVKYERNENEVTFTHKEDIEKVTKESDVQTLNKVLKFAEENDMKKVIVLSEMAFAFLAGILVVTIMLLDNIIKLFTNIHDGETPFTLENIAHINNIAKLLIIAAIIKFVGGGIAEAFYDEVFDINFSLNDILYILIIYCLSYIFEYGYEIQLDSKGKMYGDVNE